MSARLCRPTGEVTGALLYVGSYKKVKRELGDPQALASRFWALFWCPVLVQAHHRSVSVARYCHSSKAEPGEVCRARRRTSWQTRRGGMW